jgi:hypothetical protein
MSAMSYIIGVLVFLAGLAWYQTVPPDDDVVPARLSWPWRLIGALDRRLAQAGHGSQSSRGKAHRRDDSHAPSGLLLPDDGGAWEPAPGDRILRYARKEPVPWAQLQDELLAEFRTRNELLLADWQHDNALAIRRERRRMARVDAEWRDFLAGHGYTSKEAVSEQAGNRIG